MQICAVPVRRPATVLLDPQSPAIAGVVSSGRYSSRLSSYAHDAPPQRWSACNSLVVFFLGIDDRVDG